MDSPTPHNAMPLAPAQVGPVSGAVSAGWRPRLKAAAIHAALGAVVIALVLFFVLLKWYPSPLAQASGVGPIILMLLAVDLTLGPVLTFAVFDPRKRSLKWDLGVIAAIQIAGLIYGVHALDAGRPAWLVFAKDRFEIVAKADLRPEDRDAARDHEPAQAHWNGPRIVAAVSPEDPQAQREALLEAVQGGRDLQQRPDLYRDFADLREEARHRAQPLAVLRGLPSTDGPTLDLAVRDSGRSEDALGFLPVKGPARDLSMLVGKSDGALLGLVAVRPWP